MEIPCGQFSNLSRVSQWCNRHNPPCAILEMKGGDPKQAGIEVTERVKHWRNCLQKNEMTKPRGGTCTATTNVASEPTPEYSVRRTSRKTLMQKEEKNFQES